MRVRALFTGIIAGGALQFVMAFPSGAHADPSLEYAVKAAYLTKFIPFIHWPDTAFPSASSPVTICVLGDDPFGGKLEQAAVGAKAGERAVTVRRVAGPDASCQLIFLGLSDSAAVERAGETLRGKPVVTVTDSGQAGRGIISFVIADNHVRFDIDDTTAARGGVSISSKLLGLARTVKQRGQP